MLRRRSAAPHPCFLDLMPCRNGAQFSGFMAPPAPSEQLGRSDGFWRSHFPTNLPEAVQPCHVRYLMLRRRSAAPHPCFMGLAMPKRGPIFRIFGTPSEQLGRSDGFWRSHFPTNLPEAVQPCHVRCLMLTRRSAAPHPCFLDLAMPKRGPIFRIFGTPSEQLGRSDGFWPIDSATNLPEAVQPCHVRYLMLRRRSAAPHPCFLDLAMPKRGPIFRIFGTPSGEFFS